MDGRIRHNSYPICVNWLVSSGDTSATTTGYWRKSGGSIPLETTFALDTQFEQKNDTNNIKYTYPMQNQPLRTQHKLYSTSSHCVRNGMRWVLDGSCWVCDSLRWARKAFWIPTCWYRQRGSLVLEAVPNASPQWEYRL